MHLTDKPTQSPSLNSAPLNSSFERRVAILHVIATSASPPTVTDIAAKLSVPKPTLHRLVQQLVDEGYLFKDRLTSSRGYLLTEKVRQFSLAVIGNRHDKTTRHQILSNLAQKVGETCNCNIFDGKDVVYLDRVESNWPIQVQLKPGSHLPLHATASGKLFLAHMSSATVATLASQSTLTAYTDNTITDWPSLQNELKTIKANGFSYDREELIDGMVAIAIPVFNDNRQVAFTLAIHAPTLRVALTDLDRFKQPLEDAHDALLQSYLDRNR